MTREDYYGLYAIFARTDFPYAGSEEFASKNVPRQHFVALDPHADAAMSKYRQRLKEVQAAIGENESDPQAVGRACAAEERLLHRLGSPPGMPVAYAVSDGKPVTVHIHLQGDPERPGAVAERRVPRFLEKEPVTFPTDGSGRLEFARWLTRPDNPLTARVLVNRIWQEHFGRGLVPTPNNFGLRGEPPSHPELLDYLTAEFIRHGWSIKWLHRHILLSNTYQLAASATPEVLAKDPANVWLARFPRRRLDAEALCDALLAVGGNLDRAARRSSVPADPVMGLDAAFAVQGGLPLTPSQPLLDDAALPEAPVTRAVRRPRHERLDRQAHRIAAAATGAVSDERPVRPHAGRGIRTAT